MFTTACFGFVRLKSKNNLKLDIDNDWQIGAQIGLQVESIPC